MVNCFSVGSMSDDEVGEMLSPARPSLLAKENRQDLLHSILRSPLLKGFHHSNILLPFRLSSPRSTPATLLSGLRVIRELIDSI